MTTSARHPSDRSAFTAAFLSFLFPGLGHAYARAYRRAALFAVPLLVVGLVAVAIVAAKGLLWFGLWIGQTSVLGPLAVVNIVLAAYRAFAALDAYRLVLEPAVPGMTGANRVGTRSGQVHPASIAGLIAILVVLVSGHVWVSYWDLKLYNVRQQIEAPLDLDSGPTTSPEAGDTPEPTPTFSFPPQMTFEAAPTVAPWTGKGRLNILLVGYDKHGTKNIQTDSLIVVSIDPNTHQAALFSILRDATGVPLPPKSRLSQCFGSNTTFKLAYLWEYANGCVYKGKKAFGSGSDALKQALGYTFFGDPSAIKYYVAVGFGGFQKIVDTLGGVTINVGAPVFDNAFPGNSATNYHERVFFSAGLQHMTGDEALTYARIGHVYGSSVYARSVRQQQVVVALEQQANFDDISAHLSELIDELGKTVNTDLPQNPDTLLPMIQLARQVKMADIRSYVWASSHPDYGAIRSVVRSVLTSGNKQSDELQAAINEKAPIVVENGTGLSGGDTRLATYLQNLGLDAQASTDQPAQLGGPTKLLCVNGAETQYPNTLAQLEATLGLSGSPSQDSSAAVQSLTQPGEAVGFVVITGVNMQIVTPAPSS